MDKQMQQEHDHHFFADRLLDWYKVHKRDLPWRRSKNPYHIWVSEIMLQQTRVETVIPYYHKFIERFPTIEALADAPEDEVLKHWEGLGYYSRARNLQAAVREVKEQYGSQVPDTRESISKLKGVGPYTAGAILSIAYNQPEPAVDGNVMRVLSRFFCISDDIMKPATRTRMEYMIREMMPETGAGDFTQALMELGATMCTPRAPYCLVCPVMEKCQGRIAGMEMNLPVKKKAKPPRLEQRLVALIEGSGAWSGKILLRQRPDSGLLARMWELPHVLYGGDRKEPEMLKDPEVLLCERNDDATYALVSRGEPEYRSEPRYRSQEADLLYEQLHDVPGMPGFIPVSPLMRTDHIFSHIRWDMLVFRCVANTSKEMLPGDSYAWFSREEMVKLSFPNVFIRILEEYDRLKAENSKR